MAHPADLNMKQCKLKTLVLVFCCTLSLIALDAPSFGDGCEQLENLSVSDVRAFLESAVSANSSAGCVEFAIKRLGEARYEPAISVLVKFLGFRRQPTELEKNGTYIRAREWYPAVVALEEIGKPALSALLESIKVDNKSTVVRDNAVAVWMQIYKYDTPHGIARLKHEADKANDPTTKENLKSAVSKALSWCNPVDEALCNAAAKDSAGHAAGFSVDIGPNPDHVTSQAITR